MRKPSKAWTTEEDRLLSMAVKKFNSRNWKAIAIAVGSRTHTQCFQRWHKVVNPSLKKGRWTEDEDSLLLSLALQQLKSCEKRDVEKKVSWGVLCRSIKGRTAKQCRERWLNNVNPKIRRGSWTKEEDEIIRRVNEEFPNRWAIIAKHLNGRTENAVKMRCFTLLKQCGKSPPILSKRKRISGSKRFPCGDEIQQPVKRSNVSDTLLELNDKLQQMRQLSLYLDLQKKLYLLQTSGGFVRY